jgi:hypothetical protein
LRREVNTVTVVWATSASETQCPPPGAWSSASQIAWGYWIAVHASSGIAAIAARIFLFIRTVTENQTLARCAAATKLWQKWAESARAMICPVTPARLLVVTAWVSRRPLPLWEAMLPLRSLAAATTGAAKGVDRAAIWKFRPRTPV